MQLSSNHLQSNIVSLPNLNDKIQQSPTPSNLLESRLLRCHRISCQNHQQCYLLYCGDCVFLPSLNFAVCNDRIVHR
ncbi:hypothetical protein I7I50_03407 [Histoplasma capsulatum G186AR]|uniref:Uncharacterized protein n=1 Tax=Ajellomyces capsulatus TaxID=5037 RepID=A0A8H7YN69_AJECA|nr:hypothetical protein I7I52_04314 [Histoplasma capsulatum]QSS74559.1 hypothetical protein I7I50_03407 [Histoplasma capsulatum G186AR]